MQIDMGDISNENNWIVGNCTNVTYYIIGLSAIIKGVVPMNTMGLSKIVTDYGWIVKELLNTLQVTTVVTTTGAINGWYGNSPSNAWLMSIWMDMNMTQAWLIQAIDALMPVNSTMTMGHGWGYWWHPSNSSTQWMEMGVSLRQVGMWGTMAEMNRQEVMNIWGLYNQQHKRNLLPQQGPIHCDLSADSNIYSQDWSSHDHISTGQTLGSPKWDCRLPTTTSLFVALSDWNCSPWQLLLHLFGGLRGPGLTNFSRTVRPLCSRCQIRCCPRCSSGWR